MRGSTTVRRQCTRLSHCGSGGFPGVADAEVLELVAASEARLLLEPVVVVTKRWKTTSVWSSIRCRVRRARKQPTSFRLRSAAAALRPRDRSQTAGALPHPGGSSHADGSIFRFERHDTEVVDDPRRLHRHGQCRVAADAL